MLNDIYPGLEDHPLAPYYAAEHRTSHAQFGEAWSSLHKGMECLVGANKVQLAYLLRHKTHNKFGGGPDIDRVRSRGHQR